MINSEQLHNYDVNNKNNEAIEPTLNRPHIRKGVISAIINTVNNQTGEVAKPHLNRPYIKKEVVDAVIRAAGYDDGDMSMEKIPFGKPKERANVEVTEGEKTEKRIFSTNQDQVNIKTTTREESEKNTFSVNQDQVKTEIIQKRKINDIVRAQMEYNMNKVAEAEYEDYEEQEEEMGMEM